MATKNYQQITEQLIKQAKALGADAKISIRKDKSFDVNIRNGEVESLQEAISSNLSLSVNLGNKVASAATSDLSENTLNNLLLNAVERAKLSSEDESAIFPEFEKLTISPETLQMFSPDIELISPEEKINSAKELEAICLKDKRITLSAGAIYNTNESEYFLALSNGFYGTYKSSYCSLEVYLQTGEDETSIQDG
jgi:PmbA protein